MHGYNFTERVRKVLAMSREAAVELRHANVGTEHMLLGIVREGEGVACAVLENLGLDLDDVRDHVLTLVKQGNTPVGSDVPYNSRAKKVLELAMSEARELNHTYVGTEHLLIGLLREMKGVASQVLEHLGCTLEAARDETLRILGTAISAAPETESSVHLKWAVASHGRVVAVSPERAPPPPPSRFFTVLALAHAVGERMHRRLLDADVVLLALLEHAEGAAIAVLQNLGVALDQLADTLKARLDHTERAAEPGTSPDARAISEIVAQSTREQLGAGSPVLSTWHLLLAVLAAERCVAPAILAEAGVTRERVIAEAMRISG